MTYVTTFKLSRTEQRGLFLTTLCSALIGIHEQKLGVGRRGQRYPHRKQNRNNFMERCCLSQSNRRY